MDHASRLARVRAEMAARGIDTLLLSVGSDLPWLVGYEAMPLERLTMLVVPIDGEIRLVVPNLEVPRVDAAGPFHIVGWSEHEDPVAIVADAVGRSDTIAIGDHTWSRFVLALQDALPGRRWFDASAVTSPVRSVKDAEEIAALQRAASAVDAIAAEMRARPFAGRTERSVHHELVERMLDHGHQRTNFAIVAAGANAASPHHEPGDRVIEPGDIVLLDFGGRMDGYCSDITRMFHVGPPPGDVADAYTVLAASNAAGRAAGVVGAPCAAVDAAARAVIDDAGFGEYFVHRTGHGIGTEEHEDPYMVAGNETPIVAGHAFSVEPGIYLPGRYGMRLEDIVVATPEGPRSLTAATRDLCVVD